MSFLGDLGAVLGGSRFRRLFGTRLVSPFSDGLFQAGLAGFVFFDSAQPEESVRAPGSPAS
ncbi:hypothetical protein [Nocardiopsis sp. MG754419]|uniref:hypothetical protein n=1 Tax=Nocardiopsis sp. MG754419 TaxID=2259865 RepID=UPI001BABDF03|nr:hypothetical protein [Nocardiopsis sp. MG754419]MBR8741397.1 hypothetical protein [Nocardiopsis sp. MG754419]